MAEAVGRRLAGRQALLVLDNCEHVVESAAEVAASLLAAAPGLKVVATSREPLGVGGEVMWTVPPLLEADALELFTDRARQASPQFRLRHADGDAVLDICRRLEGLPLAIELAAARTRVLDPHQIAASLKDRLALLPKGPRTAPSASRHWRRRSIGVTTCSPSPSARCCGSSPCSPAASTPWPPSPCARPQALSCS